MSLTTNDIADIKQLLAANNYVLLHEMDQIIDQKLNEKLSTALAPIKQQLRDLTDFVTDALDQSNETHGKQLVDHETRISHLEQRAA